MSEATVVIVRDPDVARFWSRVDRSGDCWLWLGNKYTNGYGRLCVGGIERSVHRLSWEFANGPIPADLFVCHHCDVPACVRPDHLFLGTARDNAIDMVAKGRHWVQNHPEKLSRGDRHYSRTRPDRLPRGDRNGSRTHPERYPKGPDHPSAKLTVAAVREIRLRYQAGAKILHLAREFGVTRPAIRNAAIGRTWRNVA